MGLVIMNNIIKKSKIPHEYQVLIAIGHFSVVELQELSEIYDLDAENWNLVGLSYRNYEEYELAEDAHLKAIEIDSSNEEAYSNLQSLYLLQNKWQDYENIYNLGMKNCNTQSFIIYQDGRYHYQLGNYETAYITALSVLASDNLHNEDAFVLGIKAKLAQYYVIESDNISNECLETAFEMLKKGLFMFPNSVELHKINKTLKGLINSKLQKY